MTEILELLLTDYGPMGVFAAAVFIIFKQNRTDANRREKNSQEERKQFIGAIENLSHAIEKTDHKSETRDVEILSEIKQIKDKL